MYQLLNQIKQDKNDVNQTLTERYCTMSTDISIRVPKEMATLAEFAEGKVSPVAPYQKFTMVSLLSNMVKKRK